jgi:hypothetical protein
VKLMVAAALEEIDSTRELCRVAGLRVDLRRFLGYGFHERLAVHQTLSHAQTRRPNRNLRLRLPRLHERPRRPRPGRPRRRIRGRPARIGVDRRDRLAIKARIPITTLRDTPMRFPTFGEALSYAIDDLEHGPSDTGARLLVRPQEDH